VFVFMYVCVVFLLFCVVGGGGGGGGGSIFSVIESGITISPRLIVRSQLVSLDFSLT